LLGAVVAVALVLVSGGSDADPRTPAGLPGLPPPFLGTAVAGSGELTAAVDAYGDVVDLRPSPAGRALIDNPSARQAAGTVPADTGIVPRVSVGGGPALPLWRADSVRQRYLAETNVVRSTARFGDARAVVTVAAGDETLVLSIRSRGGGVPSVGVDVEGEVRCERERRAGQLDLLCRVGRAVPPDFGAAAGNVTTESAALVREVGGSDRRWIGRARSLSPRVPGWAREMYERSLLTLRALTDRHTGAVAAGARDAWAYVWPRDAATAALAFAGAGYRDEARRVVRFFTRVRLDEGARFYGNGVAVPGRGPQGDAPGWLREAAAQLGLKIDSLGYRRAELPDYQEGAGGSYLGNVISMAGDHTSIGASGGHIVSSVIPSFTTPGGLIRRADDPSSGLDSAAAWAVRPFPIPRLYPLARRTLLNLATEQTPYGVTPGSGWTGGTDPWTAPTAWTAWAFAALADAQGHEPVRASADRRQALRLLGDLRRAATPAGALPERVGVATGIPSSTTPLAWSHAFAILALRELWSQTR
jgi:glucoamylase